jgi:hypothetical protein
MWWNYLGRNSSHTDDTDGQHFNLFYPDKPIGPAALRHTIRDSRLCCLRFYGIVAAEYNHVPLDRGDTLSPGSPPVSTVEEVQGRQLMAGRLTSWAAKQFIGLTVCRLTARRLDGSKARQLEGSTVRCLDGSPGWTAHLLGGLTVQRFDGLLA